MMMAARPSQFTPTVSAIFSWETDLFQNRENVFVPRMRTWMDVIYDLWQCVHLAGHHVGDVGVDAGVEGSAQGRISHDALKIVSFSISVDLKQL